MKGAIGNAFILNMVITFIIIFFMLLIGSIAYSKAYKINKFLLDSLVDYVEYYNSISYIEDGKVKYLNQKKLCFIDENERCNYVKETESWNSRIGAYLSKSGYILSTNSYSCPSYAGYSIVKNTRVGDYDYCIYQKRYYELNELDDKMTKKRYSYKVVSYMKFDFPVFGGLIKVPITSESKVILNFH